MNLSKGINNLLKAITMFSQVCYTFLIYKCGLTSFEDSVISVCESFIHKNYILTKVIQWGIQEIYEDGNINDNDKLKNYFSTFSNKIPYSHDELLYSNVLIKNAIQYASAHNDELVVENETQDENNGSYYIPINSGSVALVYKGRLNDAHVVIKILRPNIRNKIKEDLDVLLNIFDNIMIKKLISYYLKINFKTFITSNVDVLLNQCDFKCEVQNGVLFKNNFKNKKNIVIPTFYTQFTDNFENMIVMEYLDGPIAKNVPLDKIHKYSEDIQSFSLETIFRYKTLHGDFHLGNIIIMNDGKSIGIIDFGIIYSVKNDLSDKLFDIVFLSFEVKDIKILNQILKNIIRLICSNESQHKTIFNIMKEDEKLINKMQCSNFSANMLIKLINKIMSLENIEIDSDLCRLLLSTMSCLQTVEYVNNNISLKKMMRLYMSKCVEM